MKRICLISIASLAALLATAFGAAGAGAAPADLDASFGGDGIVEVEGLAGLPFPLASPIDEDKRCRAMTS